MYIDKVESQSPLRYSVSLGEQRELYSSAAGKLLLAFMSKPRRDAYLDQNPLVQFTPATITSRAELVKQLEQIRKQGFSFSAGERVENADAIAAAVRHGSDVLAVLVHAGPSVRMRAGRTVLIQRVRRAAQRLSERLSATGR